MDFGAEVAERLGGYKMTRERAEQIGKGVQESIGELYLTAVLVWVTPLGELQYVGQNVSWLTIASLDEVITRLQDTTHTATVVETPVVESDG